MSFPVIFESDGKLPAECITVDRPCFIYSSGTVKHIKAGSEIGLSISIYRVEIVLLRFLKIVYVEVFLTST